MSATGTSQQTLPVIAAELLAALSEQKTRCRRNNVPFCTPYVFLALLDNPLGITYRSLETLRKGLALEVWNSLETYDREIRKKPEQPFFDFLWESREDVCRAQDYAVQDGHQEITDKYLFLSVLNTKSRTQQSFKRFLGEKQFNRLVEIVIQTSA
ncbi:hypothetical protein BST81_20530 [Leptolyngbya sp. 'hensonii']|uniref:Clp protease N-terminal domain-containing protein n=1 Tax=Leptolyngbya sp. 'hensonii' TaxID=1922337 RepID=UPI00094FB3B8|nr:Clp protease N-terminal domain-containing protein [Leptolyngbya sp. 'hensonii']OLP16586.1 hypothetical protein BST81_20530 [Leptolyngbya sp. 'hensonii']